MLAGVALVGCSAVPISTESEIVDTDDGQQIVIDCAPEQEGQEGDITCTIDDQGVLEVADYGNYETDDGLTGMEFVLAVVGDGETDVVLEYESSDGNSTGTVTYTYEVSGGEISETGHSASSKGSF